MFGLFRRKTSAPPARKMTSAELAEAICCGVLSSAGPLVTPERAMRVATVYACVRILAESVAQLPCKIYRGADDKREPVASGPLHELLHSPNSWQNSFEFREYLMACLCLRGNFFALKIKRQDEVIELLPLRPEAVSVQRKNWEPIYTYTDDVGRTGTAGTDRMLHVRGLSLDGLMGVSPIRYGRDAIGLAMATEGHGARMFKNGARPGGVLTHPGKLSDEALEHLKLSWQASHGGENSGGTAILEEGMKYESVTMTNEDAQYLDTRQFQRNEICALFRVPPHMVGDLTKSSFSNITQQSLEFVKYSVLPWCRRIETAFWRGLLSDEQRREGYRIEFLVDGLERADIKTRYESYSIAIQNGILSPNECRRLENRNPREGGDVFLQPLNMTDGSRPDAPEEEEESGKSRDCMFTMTLMAPSAKELKAVFCDAASAAREQAPACHCKEAAREAKAAAEGGDEDDEPERDDWADGEWSPEAEPLNAVMREARPKLALAWTDVVDMDVWETGRLINEYFPDDGKSAKSARDEFLAALAALYRRLRPEMAGKLEQVYHELAQNAIAAAARQAGFDPAGFVDELLATVTAYAGLEAADYAASSLAQLRDIVDETAPAPIRARLRERLERWNAARPNKLSGVAAVHAANWYAREAYRRGGVTLLRWVAQGSKACRFCAQLNGKIVGISEAFVDRGVRVGGSGTAGFVTRRKIRHPPIHRGCVCAIVPVKQSGRDDMTQ